MPDHATDADVPPLLRKDPRGRKPMPELWRDYGPLRLISGGAALSETHLARLGRALMNSKGHDTDALKDVRNALVPADRDAFGMALYEAFLAATKPPSWLLRSLTLFADDRVVQRLSDDLPAMKPAQASIVLVVLGEVASRLSAQLLHEARTDAKTQKLRDIARYQLHLALTRGAPMPGLDAVQAATREARDAAWATVGTASAEVHDNLVNPRWTKGQPWPGSYQALRWIDTPDARVLTSEGLSDPFGDHWRDMPAQNGFELEVFVAVDDPEAVGRHRWAFQLLDQMAANAARMTDLRGRLEQHGLMSIELYDVGIPEEHQADFVNDSGRVGVLVGAVDPRFPTSFAGPLSTVQLVNITLLRLDELNHAIEGGAAARKHLASQLDGVSRLDRASVAP